MSALTDEEMREFIWLEEQRERLRCEKDFARYFREVWKILEPNTELKWNWHHGLIAEYLMAVRLGEIKRLIVNVMPRSTKSLLCTVSFPTWIWTTEAEKRFLFGSFSAPLATKHSVLRRNVIESPWYQYNWGDRVQLRHDTNMKTEFANTATGQMKAAGIRGSITGEGGDYIIIDDPHDPKRAESEADREATLENFDLAWSTRLNDKANGRIIVIMQRLHANDLTAHLLAKNMGYVHLKLPTIAERKVTVAFPLTGKIVEREEGALLHPERDGPAEIEQEKKSLGSYGFAGQHQQNPVPKEGAIIKLAWIANRFYKELPAKFDAKLQSWDCAFKGEEANDPVCGLIWGKRGGEFFLFPQRFYGRADIVATIAGLKMLSASRLDVLAKWVEAKANGQAIIDTLKKDVPGLKGFDPTPYGGKEERLSAVAPLFEAGNVWLPDPSIAPWIQEYVDELTTFPKSRHKDQVDATSQALLILSKKVRYDIAPTSITSASKWSKF